jgi:Carboxypeptidase regulatory-like domain
LLAALALVVLSVSLGAASASADAPYSISGTIADTSNTGIDSLSLSLFDSSNALVDTVSTAPDGTYSFVGLVDGTYTVETTAPTGYVAIQATVVVADTDAVLNVTDPRYGTITGVLTAGAAPLSGASVKAFDSITNAEYDADSATDANGAFSITLPATTGGYAVYFTNSAGARLPIASYDFGGGAVAGGNACLLSAGTSSLLGLAAGNPIDLTVVVNSDLTPCGATTPAPIAQPTHPSTLIAQTGTTIVATPTPTPTASAVKDSSKASPTTVTAPVDLKPLLTPTASTGPMPGWGWLLVIVAVLALLGGVGFTVVRHR